MNKTPVTYKRANTGVFPALILAISKTTGAKLWLHYLVRMRRLVQGCGVRSLETCAHVVRFIDPRRKCGRQTQNFTRGMFKRGVECSEVRLPQKAGPGMSRLAKATRQLVDCSPVFVNTNSMYANLRLLLLILRKLDA